MVGREVAIMPLTQMTSKVSKEAKSLKKAKDLKETMGSLRGYFLVLWRKIVGLEKILFGKMKNVFYQVTAPSLKNFDSIISKLQDFARQAKNEAQIIADESDLVVHLERADQEI
ncbi:hypothetical protein B0O99DRAFT_594719 [Bisporella sp. PMI_857]|nr:hypothetical protein B0O99DRAFT_594719 [Bisporella sp. PMI_857]